MKEARGGVSQAKHRLWAPFSPLLCVPLPTSTSPALWSLSLKKPFHLEIMSDLQKSYTDSTESSHIPFIQKHPMLASRIIVVLLPKRSNEHRHGSVNEARDLIRATSASQRCPLGSGHKPRSHMAFSHVSSISLLRKSSSIFLRLS